MTPALLLVVAACMAGTAFLSGLFGMAGGMILIGILLAIMPLPDAMAVHAVTQMASNGWRCLLWWRYVRPKAIAGYLLGCVFALLAWSFFRYVPSKPVATLFLGLLPFGVRFLPREEIDEESGVNIAATKGVVRENLPVEVDGLGNTLDHRLGQGAIEPRDGFGPILAVGDDLAEQ